MGKVEPWYLGERAAQLAILMLTRIPDVSVDRDERGIGLDLLVRIGGPGSGGRIFGAEAKGIRKIADAVGRENKVRAHYRDELEQLAGDAPFPVALLIFDMSDDTGYFGWFMEPVVPRGEGAPEVRPVHELKVEELTNTKLREVIASVTEWYDARLACRVS